MTRSRNTLRAAAAATLLAAAFPALAQGDGPGGGPTRAPTPVTGEQVYGQVCAACHMPDAKGATGAATIPALASNPRLVAAAYPIILVLKGRGAMPGFQGALSPEQIAAVVGYVRTHFGNSYSAPVTAAEVVKLAAPPARP